MFSPSNFSVKTKSFPIRWETDDKDISSVVLDNDHGKCGVLGYFMIK